MPVFKYIEPGFVSYLAVDRPEVNTEEAFQELFRDVWSLALQIVGVDRHAVPSRVTFGVVLLDSLIDIPCDAVLDKVGIEDPDFLDDWAEAVASALSGIGVSVTNVGYYYEPNEVDEYAAAERDLASKVLDGAVVVQDFIL